MVSIMNEAFIDDIKYDYAYLNSLKNLVHERPKNNPNNSRDVALHKDLYPLVDTLMKERPTWRYKSSEPIYQGSETYFIRQLFIYDGNEVLGKLWLDHYWNGGQARFYFTNHRLNLNSNRTSFSSKPKVAAKRILKAFHMKTPTERAAEAQQRVNKAVQVNLGKTRWPYQRAKMAVEAPLLDYAIKHWDEIKDELGPDAIKSDYPTIAQSHAENVALDQMFNGGMGLTVLIEANDTYSLTKSAGQTHHVVSYTDSALPEYVRSALGLLKLVEDNAYIPDVGLRVSNNLFYITSPEPPSEE